jgi:hypothetical protein
MKRKPLLFYAACVLLLVAGAYLSFELGRYQAGYSLFDERREQEQLQQVIADKDATIDELRRQQAILETSHEIDRETYGEVKSDLDQLQAKIQAQEEELAFYRGIVSPEDGRAGLKIQDLKVTPMDSERHYLMRLVLVQAIVHNDRASGSVRVKLTGSLDDRSTELELPALMGVDAGRPISYAFRYFQSFERELTLPTGFEPATVEVDIVPSGSHDDPIKQSFQWTAVIA